MALLGAGAGLALAAKGGTSTGQSPGATQYEEKPGGQGCTPGFWKSHTGAWLGYSSGEEFDTVFGVDYDSSLTLLGALGKGGGGYEALGRHAVAALLNAAHPLVNYEMTTSQIVAAVQATFASGDPEPLKNELDELNNAGCSIDAHGRPIDD
jgi:hypothetical protein